MRFLRDGECACVNFLRMIKEYFFEVEKFIAPLFKWHDCWIISDYNCYNIPPILAILRGQRADILKTEMILDVSPFLKVSIDV